MLGRNVSCRADFAQPSRSSRLRRQLTSPFCPPPSCNNTDDDKNQGADFIECDAVFTRDCALVCRHDADLARSTDAASKFPSRAATREIDGAAFRDGVFAADLTLAEVRTLRARQAKAGPLGRTREFDGLFPLVTLDEFAEYAARVPVDGGRGWNETSPSPSSRSSLSSPAVPPRRRVVGVHVEAKHPQWHSKVLPHCAADPAAMVEAVAGVLQRHGFASRLEKRKKKKKKGSSSSSPSGDDFFDFLTDPNWLRAPTFLQCFEPGALAEAHRRRGRGKGGSGAGGVAEGVPLVQLVDEGKLVVPGGAAWWRSSPPPPSASAASKSEGGPRGGNLTFADLLSDAGLERVASYAHAIGPSVAQVLDFPRDGGGGGGGGRTSAAADGKDEGAAAFSSLVPRASKRGLAVHAYTLRDDLINLDRFKRIARGADREAEALFSGAGVEGAFGDFPLTTARAARRAREEGEERRQRQGSWGSKGGSSFAGVLSS